MSPLRARNVVARRYGSALSEKATPAMRALLVTAATAHDDSWSFNRMATTLPDFALKRSSHAIGIGPTWTLRARRSPRPDSFIPVVVQLHRPRLQRPPASERRSLAARRTV